MKDTIMISLEDAKAMFEGIKGSSFVGLTISTKPKLVGGKTNNPMFDRVRKNSTFTAYMGGNVKYENVVNNRAGAIAKAQEVDIQPFKAEGLWKGNGAHVGGAIITHKGNGKMYIFYYVPKNSKPDTDFTLDGKPIAKEKIQGLPESKDEKTVFTTDGEEIKISLVVRTTELCNIKAFRMNGKNYVIGENI